MPPRISIAAVVLLGCAWGQPFVDCNRAELVKALPELSALELDPDQSQLGPLQRAMGVQLQRMLEALVDVTISEDIHEMGFNGARRAWADHRDDFEYVVKANPFVESRKKVAAPAGFLVTGNFLAMVGDFVLTNRNASRFRYLGRIENEGRSSLLVAFLAIDKSHEGLVWIDEATHRILRIHAKMQIEMGGEKSDSFSRDVRYAAVNFGSPDRTLWLPSTAKVDARFGGTEMHTVHRFSRYQAGSKIGEARDSAPFENDGVELLVEGATDLQAGKFGDALAPLREARQKLPERAELDYFLGLALLKSHDLEAAETQFRAAVRQDPKFAAAHRELGAVLRERGDQPGATAELQEAARLEPDHSTGDATTLKVEVLQVLVPVVVTDREGHHITGLKQSDFQVFEDGIEQKITAFTSERSDAAPPDVGQRDPTPGSSPTVAKRLATRHSYVVCLDLLHMSFGNFGAVRDALKKRFQQETAGDSKYVVVALGRTIELIQDSTSDPAKVLEALNGKSFRTIFQQSVQGSSATDVSRFEALLRDVRTACDSGDPSCESRKRVLPSQATALEMHERARTGAFLTQLRSVVEQLAGDNGRRTMILLSDGILMAPGRIPFGLLQAYFPDLRSSRSMERIENGFEPIFKIAARANVTIHTIDSRGLYASFSANSAEASGRANISVMAEVDRTLTSIATEQGLTLSEISAATGGAAFRNDNDLKFGLQRAFADGREYYVLIYVPANEARDGKFRKIEVTVRNPKDVVNAKRGYWAPNLQ